MAGKPDTDRAVRGAVLWTAAVATAIFLTVQAVGFLYYDRNEALLYLVFFALFAASVVLTVFGIRRKRHIWTGLGLAGMAGVEILTTAVIPIRQHAPFEIYLKFFLLVALLAVGAEMLRRCFGWPQR